MLPCSMRELFLNNSGCVACLWQANATCSNSVGSFSCVCNIGFVNKAATNIVVSKSTHSNSTDPNFHNISASAQPEPEAACTLSLWSNCFDSDLCCANGECREVSELSSLCVPPGYCQSSWLGCSSRRNGPATELQVPECVNEDECDAGTHDCHVGSPHRSPGPNAGIWLAACTAANGFDAECCASLYFA
eukprot:562563-Rhodomonas_salina.2